MPQATDATEWMIAKEMAAILRCDPKTVRNRLKAGKLPVRTFYSGRILRAHRGDFEKYLAAGSSYTGSKVA